MPAGRVYVNIWRGEVSPSIYCSLWAKEMLLGRRNESPQRADLGSRYRQVPASTYFGEGPHLVPSSSLIDILDESGTRPRRGHKMMGSSFGLLAPCAA